MRQVFSGRAVSNKFRNKIEKLYRYLYNEQAQDNVFETPKPEIFEESVLSLDYPKEIEECYQQIAGRQCM